MYVRDYETEPVAAKSCSDRTDLCFSHTVMNRDGFLYKFFGCCSVDYCNDNLSTAMLPPEYMERVNQPPSECE